MNKVIVYNNTEVLRVEDEQPCFNPAKEGEFILVQTIPLAKLMLRVRNIDTTVLDSYNE